jgi:hypothetical protein
LDVLRETVVELHHEVVEEAPVLAGDRPFRLGGAPERPVQAPPPRAPKRRQRSSKG